MSTMEPPPRPTPVVAVPSSWRRQRGTLTHIEPHLAGRELTVWRAIAAALFTLLVGGAVLGQGVAAAYALLLLVPALMMATNRAHWWVRR